MKKLALLFSGLILITYSFSQVKSDSIYANFKNPPNSAKPRVWWHWMNGNITKEGIRKDLQWMHRSDIGGFQNFDAALTTPQIVKRRLTYMTPEWKDAFLYATRLADSLQLEMAIAASPGWSESGGPWVEPKDGMKKIVWSQTRVAGGANHITIAAPSAVTGPFQNVRFRPSWNDVANALNYPSYYQDIAVIAFKVPEADKSLSKMGATVTSSAGNFTLLQLTDGDIEKTSFLPVDTVNDYSWIQYSFMEPQTIKAVTLVGGGEVGFFTGDLKEARSLEASEDGKNFHRVCYIPAGGMMQQTITIPATTSKYFRITFKKTAASTLAAAPTAAGKQIYGTEIAEINLHTASRVDRYEQKDGFTPTSGFPQNATAASNDIVNESDIFDVTSKMNGDGSLNWIPPVGTWNIVRFGYSLLGITNHPATAEATGLEVDKLDSGAVRRYFTNYLEQYKNATGGLMGKKGLQYMVTDSWEAGAQNWTANLPQEFQKRRGYNMLPWMPVLTGYIVKSAVASERFLHDYRQTLGDLVAAYHYDQLTTILEQYGMKRYSESHENGRAFIGDGMEVKRTAAIPMSAMWTPNIFVGEERPGFVADIHESASVAHIYGQNLVAAESLTAGGAGAWSYCPENLKPTADLELASGLNRFVIHTSVHQPVDDKIPGLGLGDFGQWFTRHETWAAQAKPWVDYLARSSYLLQQGKFVADVVYYYGEDNNVTSLFGSSFPAIPEGYNYDYINAAALISKLSVKDGKLVTPTGMSYRILMLDSNAKNMTLPVLRKIHELVKAGATITGVKPVNTPSLSDDEKIFNQLVDEIWNTSNPKVFTGKPLSEVFNAVNSIPDFSYIKSHPNTRLLFVHRTLPGRDIYWVNSRNDMPQDVETTFRITGKIPELWYAETGKTEPASYVMANGVTKVRLHLSPNDAVFVVFKKTSVKATVTIPEHTQKKLMNIAGSWNVQFQKDRGAPATATFDTLVSFTENADAGIKYFSGTASYTKIITAPKKWFKKGAQLQLDLGDVKNIAEVQVNGKSAGILWKKPFFINITNALQPGNNKLGIKVTNLWVNRLIGDTQPNVTNKISYTTQPFYKADSPLLPSGLLGPVKLMLVR